MRNAYWFGVFVLLTFSLIALDFAIVTNYLQVLQGSYLWEGKSASLILSDVLFIEGALLLVVGAVFAGFSLYTAAVGTGDKLKYDYVKSVFNWETIKKEHDIPSTFRIGLVLLGVGIICIIAAIMVTL